MNWQEIIGIIGGLLGNISLVPQIARLFRYKSAYEISLPFLYLWISSLICWLAYGIALGLLAVILWNSISLILALLILVAKLKWGMRHRAEPMN